MKQIYCLFILCLLSIGSYAQNFADFFIDKTLRLDYIFSGDAKQQAIYLDELSQLPTWAGRRQYLSTIPLEGNGQIVVRDRETGECIYKNSFSSLFLEWLSTDEAKTTSKGFEHTLLIPYPKRDVNIDVELFNPEQEIIARIKHVVQPNDILIHKRGESHITPHRYMLQSGDPKDCINVAILAEGYTEKEMETFYKDAQTACESIFSHEPFREMKNKFNVVAVASPSIDSGVSVPRDGNWKETAVQSNFDTFYSERYLTTNRVKSIHNALAGIPYEHIIILANTDVYGGGGIFNSYTLTTAHHEMFKPVVVHEFGHSFGGLADEYFYDEDVMNDTYPLDVEPWEPNITTLVDFNSKWKDMLSPLTPIPTPVAQKAKYPTGVYEGAGYSAKGIYRPSYDCRMKTNEYPEFCPVCKRAIKKMIEFYVP